MIKEYSDLTKMPWKDVWFVDVIEFFNLIAFSREFNRKQAEAFDKWRNTH